MEMINNDRIIWIDDRTIRLKGIDGVAATFAQEENPDLVDTILGMVIRGSVSN